MSDDFFHGLNLAQQQACSALDGPVLILAGAGSGKTRTLTHRVACLIKEEKARPQEILAVTFTNKAARELRERLNLLMPGGDGNRVWAMTFHALCARILRTSAPAIGFPRSFSIADTDDSRKLIKGILQQKRGEDKLESGEVGRLHKLISHNKNHMKTPQDLERSMMSWEQEAAQVWRDYQQSLQTMGAFDFDDLLLYTIKALDTRDGKDTWATRFRYLLVDEYQDTNQAQYHVLKRLCSGHRNLCVVGDDDQCLAAGTQITMADETSQPIEKIKKGDCVRSCFGSGDFRGARVVDNFASTAEQGISITTESGLCLVSTPEHIHFAGYDRHLAPLLYMTYVMWQEERGFRIGSTRTYPKHKGTNVNGEQLQCRQEAADAGWIISTHNSKAVAQAEAVRLSATYQLPTVPFKAQRGDGANGLVYDQAAIDRLFASLPTGENGKKLLRDQGLSFAHPHHTPQTGQGGRRTVVIVLCGDHRGQIPMHVISMDGRGTGDKAALERIGLSVRSTKKEGQSWRYESCFKDYQAALSVLERIRGVLPVTVVQTARFGNKEKSGNRALSFLPASSVRVGMTMFNGQGGYELVRSIEQVQLESKVYDLDVEQTHNFVANGLITHNSIYAFRGAEVEHILRFTEDWPDAKVVKLEKNYRSSASIIEAANAIIGQNLRRSEKTLKPTKPKGAPVSLNIFPTPWHEARNIAGAVVQLRERGVSMEDIAVLYRQNSLSRMIEELFTQQNIPYRVVGGTEFYKRAEIKTARSYLQLLANPADHLAFGRAIANPRRGVGDASLQSLSEEANRQGVPFLTLIQQSVNIPGLGAKAGKALKTFAELFERAAAIPATSAVHEVFEFLLQQSTYIESLLKNGEEGAERVANIGELVNLASRFHTLPWREGIVAFLEQTALAESDHGEDQEGVTLMTLHATKGLEFPYVFLCGAEDELFLRDDSDTREIEESRRLLYVGMTRAMEQLYLSLAESRLRWGEEIITSPLRFLEDLPSEVIRRSPEVPQYGAKSSYAGAPKSRPRPIHKGNGATAKKGESAAVQEALQWLKNKEPKESLRPVPVQQPQTDARGYVPGERVRHAKFGQGVVIKSDGDRIVIRFGDKTTKTLMKSYARLEPAE